MDELLQDIDELEAARIMEICFETIHFRMAFITGQV